MSEHPASRRRLAKVARRRPSKPALTRKIRETAMSDDSPRNEKTPIDRLLELLALETLDRDLFLGDPGRGKGRLFGGMVAAQSVIAAFATLDESDAADSASTSLLHSIHAYFLRPGRYDLPIRFVGEVPG